MVDSSQQEAMDSPLMVKAAQLQKGEQPDLCQMGSHKEAGMECKNLSWTLQRGSILQREEAKPKASLSPSSCLL